MSSTSDATWHWPKMTTDSAGDDGSTPIPGAFEQEHVHEQEHETRQRRKPQTGQSQIPRSKRSWPPRTCRICFETVLPTFQPTSSSLPGVLQGSPSVTYISDDPASGRLIRPCKCKGSSRYVHEGCLQEWRHADPDYGKRNYWQCPTCGFRYRLERMRWGRAISSTGTQLALTVSILFVAMFVLGFVADPIINLYLDPYSTIMYGPFSQSAEIDSLLSADDATSWTEHFIKGLASLGLLGFVKVLFALSPWQWWNLRSSGIMRSGSRTGDTGRERLANISWIVIVVGVITFLLVRELLIYKLIH